MATRIRPRLRDEWKDLVIYIPRLPASSEHLVKSFARLEEAMEHLTVGILYIVVGFPHLGSHLGLVLEAECRVPVRFRDHG